MTDATELDEAAVRARVEAATEGPWLQETYRDGELLPDGTGGMDDYESPGRWVYALDAEGYSRMEIDCNSVADAEFIAHARTDLPAALDEITRLRAENAEMLARLQRREAAHAERLAESATEGDTGICRTCTLPIVFATVEEPGYLPRSGWSDGACGDALVCFKAVGYRHVPLVGRERGIWDAAVKAAGAALEETEAEVSRWEVHFATAQEQRDEALARAEAAEYALAAVRALARSWSGRHDLLMTGDSAAHDIEAALAANTTTDPEGPAYPAGHGFTPGKFSDRCRVMLARHPCNYEREQHDPALPPEDIDVFGYRRRAAPTTTERSE